jgi:hypothetical protein
MRAAAAASTCLSPASLRHPKSVRQIEFCPSHLRELHVFECKHLPAVLATDDLCRNERNPIPSISLEKVGNLYPVLNSTSFATVSAS